MTPIQLCYCFSIVVSSFIGMSGGYFVAFLLKKKENKKQ